MQEACELVFTDQVVGLEIRTTSRAEKRLSNPFLSLAEREKREEKISGVVFDKGREADSR
jgi:hypothetical protein